MQKIAEKAQFLTLEPQEKVVPTFVLDCAVIMLELSSDELLAAFRNRRLLK